MLKQLFERHQKNLKKKNEGQKIRLCVDRYWLRAYAKLSKGTHSLSF